jgi:hypothetical protein
MISPPSSINIKQTLPTFKVVFLELFLLTLAVGNAFGQGLMPPVVTNKITLPKTAIQVDGTTMNLCQSTQATVNVDGWVGVVIPAGQTNPVIVEKDSTMASVSPIMTIETTPDGHQKLLGPWLSYSWTNSADLQSWGVTTVWWQPVYCEPFGTAQQFFRQ